MSICDKRQLIQSIDIDECVGNSLIKITTNTDLTENEICVSREDVNALKNEFELFTTKVNDLSSNLQKFAKASVSFNGNSFGLGTGLRDITTTNNIASVSSLDIGRYAITFTQSLLTNNYALVGSAQSATVHPTTFTSASAIINILNPQGAFVDSNYVSILIYNT